MVKSLDKLVYLLGALCEFMRLYPSVPFELISAIKSDILPSGENVIPNTLCMLWEGWKKYGEKIAWNLSHDLSDQSMLISFKLLFAPMF